MLTATGLALGLAVTPAGAAPDDEGVAVAKAVSDEGIVLLENDAALPFSRGAQLSVFGSTQVAPFLGGGGSGSVIDAGGVGFLDALRGEGFQVNESLAQRYETWWNEGLDGGVPGKEQDYRPVSDTGGTFDEFGINSVARAEMDLPSDVLAQAGDFSGTAVVVIGRNGSEVHDPGLGDLELYPDEREMIDAVASTFDEVVVLFNTGVALEMGFLDEHESIKAAAVVWTPGQAGMLSVADVLSGDVNPSGKLPHTIAHRTEDHPSTVNFGDFVKPGSEPGLDKYYVQYEEGIYVGYRYFETFDVPVQFPFGHGLSYTSFERDVLDVEHGPDGLSVTTRVTNTGDVPGKEVVQVYVEAPAGELEKPAKELRAFAKTDLLAPGQSQLVTTTVDTYGLSSWSEERGAYLLDAGEYTVHSGASVQDVDVAGSFRLSEPVVIDEDPATGARLENRFAEAGEGLTVLSQSDPEGTAPTAPATGTRTVPNTSPRGSGFNAQGSGNPPGFLNAPDAMPVLVDGNRIALAPGQTPAEVQLTDVHADPTRMDAFLAQFTDAELVAMHLQGGFKTIGLDRLGIPATAATDGPAQVKAPAGSGQPNGTGFPAASMLAATWNTELAHRYGSAAAAEARALGVDAWYAPGANTHRNPMGGRNFEYYSEDPLLGAGMMADVVVGAGQQGVTTVVKHFVGNEQEQNRQGVETYVSERALREIYLKPFEYGVKAGSLGIMASFNRLGETWVGATPELLQGVARGEWGFDGFVVSDIWISPYMNAVSASAAGTDLMLNIPVPGYDQQGLADFSRALTEDHERTRAALEANTRRVLTFVMTTPAFSEVLGSAENTTRALDPAALPFSTSTELRRDVVDLADLRQAFHRYVEQEQVAGPLTEQMTAALDAAARHAEQGRTDQAVRQLERFIGRLDSPARQLVVSAEAKERLSNGVAAVMQALAED
ncbi:glycoside hydrolase family 3 N-terminal domain-containing protein [Modestobacter sp. VKM Ac-2985]|uniref:glycoside hydrolase family 3 N-terminal domain-containing protein n=1 Tax=Modestobacter sp. VKM Ac-2985 TaxID=3004139 RepID=UPI0022AB8DDA|nr:glycoside hydrolase family 3 N-terminal domain-containing protein [Modestobacter sp. VKM Ac-2985]MCZ2838961.1 glycoside hydrolase family 3 C-terminal domain-containing protein [Modestobacter sp. VKM Ac-2985]